MRANPRVPPQRTGRAAPIQGLRAARSVRGHWSHRDAARRKATARSHAQRHPWRQVGYRPDADPAQRSQTQTTCYSVWRGGRCGTRGRGSQRLAPNADLAASSLRCSTCVWAAVRLRCGLDANSCSTSASKSFTESEARPSERDDDDSVRSASRTTFGFCFCIGVGFGLCILIPPDSREASALPRGEPPPLPWFNL